ncbi:MAG: hypothetical protein WCO51_10360 [bacterium]
MVLLVVQFVGLLMMGIAAGVAFGLVLQARPKSALPSIVFLDIHQVLLRNYGSALRVIEGAAFFAVLIALPFVRENPKVFTMTWVSLICIAAMILIWTALIQPINKQVQVWNLETMPDNWAQTRSRWDRYQILRGILAIIGLCALILSVLV